MLQHVLALGSNRQGFGCLGWTPGGVTWIGDVVGHVGGGTRQVGPAAAPLAWLPPPWLAYVAPGVVGCLPGGFFFLFFLLFSAYR